MGRRYVAVDGGKVQIVVRLSLEVVHASNERKKRSCGNLALEQFLDVLVD
jgi:hypothetical protein